MREEILINVTPQETRVAMLENGMLQEVYIERVKNKGIVGNIYLGKVVRVLPGMQAAFIDIGLERTAFLHARDLTSQSDECGNNLQQSDQEVQISSLLHEGEKVLVQVVKDPIGSKGARLTGQISIPARNLVYLPNNEYFGISQRIQEDETRESLMGLLKSICADLQPSGGFIIRTAGENSRPEEIQKDMEFLLRLWQRVLRREKEGVAPSLVHQDLPLAVRTVRDLVWQNVEKIKIDSRETFDLVCEFAHELIPEAVSRIEHYPGARPIFDLSRSLLSLLFQVINSFGSNSKWTKESPAYPSYLQL